MAADTHANKGPVPINKADAKRMETLSPQFCKQGEPMPRRATGLLTGTGESITKTGIAPTLHSASQSTSIVLSVLSSLSLQCNSHWELAVSASSLPGCGSASALVESRWRSLVLR